MRIKKLADLFFAVTMIFFVSCQSPSSRKTSYHEVRAVLDSILPLPEWPRTKLITRQEIAIYFDGSESCRGFVIGGVGSASGTSYCDFLHVLRTWLAADSNIRYFKFGAMDVPKEIERCEAAASPGFYLEERTRLIELMGSVIQEDTIPETFLVVTDGIPSTRTRRDIIYLVRPVLRLMKSGYSFNILGILSEFNGSVFSETNGGVRLFPKYHSTTYGRRPFYCFIFSSAPDFAQELSRRLSDRQIDHHLLDLSSVFFTAKTPCCSTRTYIGGREKNALKRHSQESNFVRLQRRSGKSSFSRGVLETKLDLVLAPGVSDFRLGSEEFKDTAVCLDVDSRTLMPSNHRITKFELLRDSTDRARIDCSLSFQVAAEHGCLWYKIFIFPDVGTFQPPEWVEEWSTGQDIAVEDFNRTLFLKEFVEGVMSEGEFKYKPFATLYVEVK